MSRPETIICDIDGCIFPHEGDITRQHLLVLKPLPEVLSKWVDWDRRGCRIILMTGRRESVRPQTEAQLAKAGIFYDILLMGQSGGKRILINDFKEGAIEDTALAINLERNEGFQNVKI